METQFLNMNEASNMLRVSKSNLYKRVMRKNIPFHKIGSRTVFDSKELIEFVKGNKPVADYDDLTLPSIKI